MAASPERPPRGASPPGAVPDQTCDAVMPDPGDAITRIERVARCPALGGSPGVEITLTSVREFPVLGELAVLRIGSRLFTLSRYASGDLHTLVFTLTLDEFDALDDRAPVSVQYGSGNTALPSGRSWSFGPLRKQCLQ